MNLEDAANALNALNIQAVGDKKFEPQGGVFLSIEKLFPAEAKRMREALVKELQERGLLIKNGQHQVTVSNNGSSVDVLLSALDHNALIAGTEILSATDKLRELVGGDPNKQRAVLQLLTGTSTPKDLMEKVNDVCGAPKREPTGFWGRLIGQDTSKTSGVLLP